MAISELTAAARDAALASLNGWAFDAGRNALFREIVCGDFVETFALMTRIAFEAEKADHHPEWSNVYNRLSIWLTTHDAGGVSDRDLSLARTINSFVDQDQS